MFNISVCISYNVHKFYLFLAVTFSVLVFGLVALQGYVQ